MDKNEKDKYLKAKDVQIVMQRLMEAAKEGDLSKLQEVIDDFRANEKFKAQSVSNEEVVEDFRDGRGRTCLHFAAAAGHINIVEFLLKLCPKAVHFLDDNEDTALHLAVSHQRIEMVNLLLECGASADIPNSEMVTPLHYACGNGSLDLVKILLSRGADLSRSSKGAGTPLHWAAGEGFELVVAELLTNGADPNLTNAQGLPPLLLAAAAGRKASACVAQLARAGADTGLLLQGGLTVVHIAADTGDLDALQALLETPNGQLCAKRCDDRGLKPIEIAAENGYQQLVEFLLPHSEMGEQANVADLLAAGEVRANQVEKESQNSANGEDGGAGYSFTLESMEPAKTEQAAEEAKQRKLEGNALFAEENFEEAIEKYTRAIELDGSDAVFWSNRSACYMELGQHERALANAEVARKLRPEWPKACYRMAVARLALEKFEDAAMAAWEGLKLDEENYELKSLLKKCVKKGREDHFKEKS